MRIAVLSDVHANLEALTAVLEACEAAGADRRVCLGDVVGYGPDPDGCVDLIRRHCDVVVLGNHDAAVARRLPGEWFYDAAREALDWSRGRLSADNLAWLERLPLQVDEPGVRYTHGSPLRPAEFDYLIALEQAWSLVESLDELAEINFIGHSHLCRSFALLPDRAIEVVAPRFPLQPGRKYVVTVGSVGQPRDYDHRAAFGLFDTEARTFEYVRADYDVAGAARKIVDRGLAPSFGRRLFLGI